MHYVLHNILISEFIKILEEITRYMIRNPKSEGPVTIFTGNSGNSVEYEYDYDMTKFVNVPVKKGKQSSRHLPAQS